jgi:DNA polymerase III sliding clamp (beta) subunit (PCNA family)
VKVTFVVSELKQRLAELSSVVARKSTEALYRSVRLFTDADGVVNIQGIDIDTTMTLKMPAAKADGLINVLLDYSFLNGVVPTLGSAEAVITSKNETEAVLSSGKYRARLQTAPTAPFTDLPIVAGIAEKPELGGYTFGLPGLKAQIELINFAVPTIEGRHVVASALLTANATELNIVGTDGMVLAVSTTPCDIGEFSFTVPKPALELINKLEGGTKVTISDTEGAFFFETETELVTYNKTHAEFPPYQTIIPKLGVNNINITFKDKVELVSSLVRQKLSCVTTTEKKERPVNINYDGASTVNLAAVKEDKLTTGNIYTDMATDSIAVEGSGASIKIKLDILKLMHFLERATFPITVHLNSNNSIADMHSAGGTPEKPTYRFLVMPMRGDDDKGGSVPIPQVE